MAAQSFLAKNGLRTGVLGSVASLAIAFSSGNDPAAGTGANRTGWFADLTGGAEAISTVIAATTIETVTANGLELNRGGLLFNERAAVPAAPGAAKGYLWVRNDAPNVLVFTDDAGTDTVLGGGGELLLSTTGTDNLGTENLGSFGSITGSANQLLAAGRNALAAVTSAFESQGLGGGALSALTTGSGHTAVGHNALDAMVSGLACVGVGRNALGLATGNFSVGVGESAGSSLTTGSGGTFVGRGSQPAAGTDDNATAVGFNSSAASESFAGGSGASADFASSIGLGSGTATTASNQFVAGSLDHPATDVYFGSGPTAAAGGIPAAVDYTIHGTDQNTSNGDTAGYSITIAGGRGTGTGAGGNIVFQTAPAGTPGTTLNVLATVATITEKALFLSKGFRQDVTTVVGSGLSPDATADGTVSVYLLNGSAATCTLNLDASPVDGQRYEIKSIDSTNTVTIGRNGNTIDGVAADVTLATLEAVTLIYDTVSGWWII